MRNFLIYYYLTVNVLLFLLMAYDKRKAKKREWRIPEKTLLLLAFLGGAPGGIGGMLAWRHKTKKILFVILYPLALLIHLFVLYKLVSSGII